jgi:hypothetical protein
MFQKPKGKDSEIHHPTHRLTRRSRRDESPRGASHVFRGSNGTVEAGLTGQHGNLSEAGTGRPSGGDDLTPEDIETKGG